MVGRGTRIDIVGGKLMFRVYDYTDATLLFGEEFVTRPPKSSRREVLETPGADAAVLRVEGFEVHITDAGHLIVAERDGKAMPIPVEEYRERLAAQLVTRAQNLEEFRACWIDPLLFDVVLTNPPFGGKEGKEAQTNFDYRTSATQVLFLQHVIRSLRSGGRCGIVLDEGLLFHTNQDAFVKTKKKLLDDCNLWCVVSLPGGVFTAAGAGVKTNLLFFTKGEPTRKIWYYDLSDVKVGKKPPLTQKHFVDFFKRLSNREESDASWTVDLDERKRDAAREAKPLKEEAARFQREARDAQDRLQELKSAQPRDHAAIADADARYKELKKSARDAANKAQAIEYAVYDLKAVNPNRRPVVDTRTPEDLLKIIDAKGRAIQDALAVLRK